MPRHYIRLTVVHGRKVKLYSRTGAPGDVWTSSLEQYDNVLRAKAERGERILNPGSKPPMPWWNVKRRQAG